MRPLELRIKYKSDTGESPTYGKDSENVYNFKGGLKHDYAEWLEEYRGDIPTPMSMTWQRNYFLKDTGLHGTYYDKKRVLRYTKQYKEWLEELLCKALTSLGK